MLSLLLFVKSGIDGTSSKGQLR